MNTPTEPIDVEALTKAVERTKKWADALVKPINYAQYIGDSDGCAQAEFVHQQDAKSGADLKLILAHLEALSPCDKIQTAYYDGAMAALGCEWWETGPDFFALVAQSYARGEPLPPTMPKRALAPPEAPAASPRAGELTADFARSFPGGALDDSAYEAIESALDKADAPCQGNGGKWLTLPERIEALAARHLLPPSMPPWTPRLPPSGRVR